MAIIKTSLAWAIPVKVEVLGAHVEAYQKLLPTLNTLRLCHRFGRNAPITCLPAELLLCIEDVLIEEERRRDRKTWAKEFKCFQHDCHASDHWSKTELKWHRRRLELGANPYDEYYHRRYTSCTTDEERDDCFEDWLIENHPDRHFQRRISWRSRIPFTNTRDVLINHFGLVLWASTLRLSGSADDDSYVADETSLAYLTIPGGISRTSAAEWSQEDNEGGFPMGMESCSTMDLTSLPKLSRSDKVRFKRAMNILGLKPHLHQSQKPSTVSKATANHVLARKKTRKRTSETWPRLMMLTNWTCEL